MKKETFRLAGLQLKGKTTNQNHQSSKDCGSLWEKFHTENIASLIPEKMSDEIYAVYFDYEKDENAPFSYFIGCKVAMEAEIPGELDKLIIPAQQYRQYVAKGRMPDCVTEAWKTIWNSDIKRKFGYDFEVYDQRSENRNAAEVDLFISVTD